MVSIITIPLNKSTVGTSNSRSVYSFKQTCGSYQARDSTLLFLWATCDLGNVVLLRPREPGSAAMVGGTLAVSFMNLGIRNI